jgi:hypothetical protein
MAVCIARLCWVLHGALLLTRKGADAAYNTYVRSVGAV